MKKNGKIELMRFLFSVSVLLFHANQIVWKFSKTITEHIGLFNHGNMGVEFFFVVSGFLMAKSISSRIRREGPLQNAQTLGTETVVFLWRKIKAILPYHVPYCLLMIALLWQTKADDRLEILRRLPSFFFLNRTGIMQGSNLLGVEWYLSAMFLAMAILYPLLRRNYDLVARLVCPLTAILVLGWMNRTYGYLTTSNQWDGLTFHCNLRALGELCLGVTGYEVCCQIQKHSYNLFQRLLFSVTEVVCYALVFCYVLSTTEDGYWQVYVALLLTVAVTISFSQAGLFAKTFLFQNPLWVFLGGISLPIYLIQQLFQDGIKFYCPDLPKDEKAFWMCALTLVFGALSYIIVSVAGAISVKAKRGKK